jgi:transmembrane sensor
MALDPEEQARIAEQASIWLEKIERTLSAEEGKSLRKWLKSSPIHRDLIIDRCKRWHGPEILAVLAELVAVEHLSDRIERHYGRMLLAIVLSVSGLALATVVIAVSKVWPRSDAHRNPMRAEIEVRTDVGAMKTLQLPDGGTIVLNTNSKVLLKYEPKSRDVILLRGEMAVDARHDANRPFMVIAARRAFVVMEGGAKFNVRRLTDQDLEVTVQRGQIKVLAGYRAPIAAPVLLRSRVSYGEHIFATHDAGRLGPDWQRTWHAQSDEVFRLTCWQEGRVRFEQEPLEDALSEIERYTSLRFAFVTQELRGIRITAQFRVTDVEGVRRYLREEFSIASLSAGRAIMLSREAVENPRASDATRPMMPGERSPVARAQVRRSF